MWALLCRRVRVWCTHSACCEMTVCDPAHYMTSTVLPCSPRSFTVHWRGLAYQAPIFSGIDADAFNSHYANVSTDPNYTTPSLKLTAASVDQDYISEWSIFKALDTLRPTATGLDRIPTWFLRLGSAVFCKPLAYLFNQSIASSSVPSQWKQAIISPYS